MADRVTGPESEVFGAFWHEEAAPLQSEGRIFMAVGLAEGGHQRLVAPRGTPQRKVVRVLRLSKSAISLQSVNVNYKVLPCPYSAARAL
jgi:hypothetical protein